MSESHPMISVVVPAFNAGRYLNLTIGSLISQSLSTWEAIIVDDGSTDSTAAESLRLSHQDARVRYVHQANGGVGTARNHGLAVASKTSEFVLFLDSDDLLLPHALEALLSKAEQCPEAVAVHGLGRYIDETGQPIRSGEAQRWTRERRQVAGLVLRKCTADEPTDFAMLAYRSYIITPGSCLVRREPAERVGGFDTALRNAEDFNFWLRLSLGGPIAFLDREVIEYRIHSGGKSRNNKHFHKRDMIARGRLYVTSNLTRHQRFVLTQGFRWKQVSEAADKLRGARESLVRGHLPGALRELARASLAIARAFRGFTRAAFCDTE